MAAAPRQEAASLSYFLWQLTGVAPRLVRLYGLLLENERGQRAAYVGLDQEGSRPDSYLPSLAPGVGPTAREAWGSAPGRLRYLWQQGFCHRGAPVLVLRDLPPGAETAAAFALEEALGVGRGIGGILALDPRVDSVHDASALLRLHDRGLCVTCGLGGHLAGARACRAEGLAERELPLLAQRAKRRLCAVEPSAPAPAPPPPPAAADAPAAPILPVAAAAPAAPHAPAAPALVVHVPTDRLGPPQTAPRTWPAMQRAVTFFDAGGVRVCLARDLVAAMHQDPRHGGQDVARWRDRGVAHVREAIHCWQPARCRGVRGVTPYLLSEATAEAVFEWLRRQ
jgi:hypothetical protein